MKEFKDYLREKNLAETTVKSYTEGIKIFLQWLKGQYKEAWQTTYGDMLNYIAHCMNEGKSKRYTNQLLGITRHYFEHLKEEKTITSNPASTLTVRGVNRRIPHDLLNIEELEEIYKNYQNTGIIYKRNKVILGLMIYQGLKPEEIELLEPINIKLKEGKIIIKGTRRTNGRTLKIEATQVIEIQEYINKTRNILIEIRGKESVKLLISTGTGEKLRNSIDKMIRHLRKKYLHLKTPEQIRQSVISHWIKTQDIRQVQYMAGHKYVSSTERYQGNNLEDLHEQLKQHHPIR